MSLADIYKDKRVFLTGHTGFKGSWLLSWLHELGATVLGYALPPLPEHKLYEQISGDKLCQSAYHNILDYKSLEENLLEFRPDFIFHLAAQPIVRTSYEIPLDTFSVNTIGTANLLNAVRSLENPCIVIIITTDKVYQNDGKGYPYKETDPLGGYDPYSASKACAELVTASYRNSFFNPEDYSKHKKSIASVRAGNVIGGGDWAKDRIVPDTIRALQKKESIAVRNPTAVRPWQHVLEPLYGYLLLGKELSEDPVQYATAYNFGSRDADCWTVGQMVKAAIHAWGSGEFHVEKEEKPLHEAALLKLDISKAARELNWRPSYTATQAIEKTVRWYKDFEGSNAHELIRKDFLSFNPG